MKNVKSSILSKSKSKLLNSKLKKMKNQFLTKILILTLFFGLFSCSKLKVNNPLEKESQNIGLKNGNSISLSTDGNVLIFNTIDDYERAFQTDSTLSDAEIETHQNAIMTTIRNLNYDKFTSSSTYNDLVNSGKIEDYPNFVLQVLNKDGIVQIGQFLFKLDFLNEKAYSLPICMKNTRYNDLKLGVCDQIDVKEYSWDKEIIYDAHGEDYKLGCGESAATTSKDTLELNNQLEWGVFLNGNIFTGQYLAGISGNVFKGSLKARYRITPLGWDLYSKVILTSKSAGANINTGGDLNLEFSSSTLDIPLKLVWERRYKLKCKTDTGYKTYSKINNGSVTGQSWQGIRACNKYILGASVFAQVNGNWEYLNFNEPTKNVNGTLYQVCINKGY